MEEKYETVSAAEPRRSTPVGVPIARGTAPNEAAAADIRGEALATEKPGTASFQESPRERRVVEKNKGSRYRRRGSGRKR